MGVVVKKAGICTTIQDLGRIGYQGSGFSPSGVMDHRACTLANLLVENDPNTCVIEFALIGPTLRFTTNTIIAITGGDFSPLLGGKPVPMYKAIMVHRGSVLSFGAPRTGCYGYISIGGGGLDVPEVMGSCSTNLRCSVGGWHGRKLNVGDSLPFKTPNLDFLANLPSHVIAPDDIYGFGQEQVTLRVVPGPQDDAFTQVGLDTFYGSAFTITNQCDRMGFRIDGPEIETKNGSDIISDGIAFGAVQVPSKGRIIIMLADRQTTGGYAKIGTIASVDIPKLVQRKPGDRIVFQQVSVQEAQDLLRQQARYYSSVAKAVKRLCSGGTSPRRTARRLTPILERQARIAKDEVLWINTEDRDRDRSVPQRKGQ